jgi:hypothetical protein
LFAFIASHKEELSKDPLSSRILSLFSFNLSVYKKRKKIGREKDNYATQRFWKSLSDSNLATSTQLMVPANLSSSLSDSSLARGPSHLVPFVESEMLKRSELDIKGSKSKKDTEDEGKGEQNQTPLLKLNTDLKSKEEDREDEGKGEENQTLLLKLDIDLKLKEGRERNEDEGEEKRTLFETTLISSICSSPSVFDDNVSKDSDSGSTLPNALLSVPLMTFLGKDNVERLTSSPSCVSTSSRSSLYSGSVLLGSDFSRGAGSPQSAIKSEDVGEESLSCLSLKRNNENNNAEFFKLLRLESNDKKSTETPGPPLASNSSPSSDLPLVSSSPSNWFVLVHFIFYIFCFSFQNNIEFEFTIEFFSTLISFTFSKSSTRVV